MTRKDVFGWIGTTLTLPGVAMQALMPASFIPWSYPVFFVAASAWLSNAWMERNRPHMVLQFVLVALNSIATWRYLIPEIFV
ncbi:MAG: hypothetical protein ACREXP_03380 [Steroidobacteraceae bacterium]